MKIEKMYEGAFRIDVEKHEILVLKRYVKLLKNTEINDVESLIAWMMQTQVDFVMDSLVCEADIKVTDVNPGYTKWQRFCKWLGKL